MNKKGMRLTACILLLGLTLSMVSIAAAQEAPAVSHKQECSRFKQFTGWLRKSYGAPRRDAWTLWEWSSKYMRWQEIPPELSQKAKSVLKRWSIPIGAVIAAIIYGVIQIGKDPRLAGTPPSEPPTPPTPPASPSLPAETSVEARNWSDLTFDEREASFQQMTLLFDETEASFRQMALLIAQGQKEISEILDEAEQSIEKLEQEEELQRTQELEMRERENKVKTRL